jgi:hypothetical protein
MNAHTIGSKYRETQGLDVAEIAKLVRKDIKAAQKRGDLPKAMKASVRIERYSGGQSLDVEIKSGVSGVLNKARIDDNARNPYGQPVHPILSDYGKALLDTIKALVGAYNFDNSDLQTDYHYVRFFSHIQFSSVIRAADRAARLACPVGQLARDIEDARDARDLAAMQRLAVRCDQLMATLDDADQLAELEGLAEITMAATATVAA